LKSAETTALSRNRKNRLAGHVSKSPGERGGKKPTFAGAYQRPTGKTLVTGIEEGGKLRTKGLLVDSKTEEKKKGERQTGGLGKDSIITSQDWTQEESPSEKRSACRQLLVRALIVKKKGTILINL